MKRRSSQPVKGQRGIATFLTGGNTPKDSSKQTPQQQDDHIFHGIAVEGCKDVPGEAAAADVDVRLELASPIACSDLASDSESDGQPQKRHRGNSDETDTDNDVVMVEDADQHGNTKAPAPTTTPTTATTATPAPSLFQPTTQKQRRQQRQQTQRVKKGQSDGAWRRKQQPHRFQADKWWLLHPWAVCIPADEAAGEVHDRARCVVCSLAERQDVTMAARAVTLRTHEETDGHVKALQKEATGKQNLELLAAQGGTLDVMFEQASLTSDHSIRCFEWGQCPIRTEWWGLCVGPMETIVVKFWALCYAFSNITVVPFIGPHLPPRSVAHEVRYAVGALRHALPFS